MLLPEPLNKIDCVLFEPDGAVGRLLNAALSVNTSVAARPPEVLGVNVTLTVQVPPTATGLVVLHVADGVAKFVGLVPPSAMLDRVTDDVPKLDRVTV